MSAVQEMMDMDLAGKKIGVLFESDYYENEIFYYKLRFAEEGIDLHFLTRLWGQQKIAFTGHEYKIPMECNESFEDISDDELRGYAAIIVPSGMVADRLRYTEDLGKIPPATAFLQRAFNEPGILKAIICHGLWLTAPIPGLIKGRKLTCHNNLHGDAMAYGAEFVDQDLVIDGDLITARTGGHCHLLARGIIDILKQRE